MSSTRVATLLSAPSIEDRIKLEVRREYLASYIRSYGAVTPVLTEDVEQDIQRIEQELATSQFPDYFRAPLMLSKRKPANTISQSLANHFAQLFQNKFKDNPSAAAPYVKLSHGEQIEFYWPTVLQENFFRSILNYHFRYITIMSQQKKLDNASLLSSADAEALKKLYADTHAYVTIIPHQCAKSLLHLAQYHRYQLRATLENWYQENHLNYFEITALEAMQNPANQFQELDSLGTYIEEKETKTFFDGEKKRVKVAVKTESIVVSPKNIIILFDNMMSREAIQFVNREINSFIVMDATLFPQTKITIQPLVGDAAVCQESVETLRNKIKENKEYCFVNRTEAEADTKADLLMIKRLKESARYLRPQNESKNNTYLIPADELEQTVIVLISNGRNTVEVQKGRDAFLSMQSSSEVVGNFYGIEAFPCQQLPAVLCIQIAGQHMQPDFMSTLAAHLDMPKMVVDYFSVDNINQMSIALKWVHRASRRRDLLVGLVYRDRQYNKHVIGRRCHLFHSTHQAIYFELPKGATSPQICIVEEGRLYAIAPITNEAFQPDSTLECQIYQTVEQCPYKAISLYRPTESRKFTDLFSIKSKFSSFEHGNYLTDFSWVSDDDMGSNQESNFYKASPIVFALITLNYFISNDRDDNRWLAIKIHIQTMLSGKINLQLTDSEGNNALHWAVLCVDNDICEWAIQSAHSQGEHVWEQLVSARNQYHETPLDMMRVRFYPTYSGDPAFQENLSVYKSLYHKFTKNFSLEEIKAIQQETPDNYRGLSFYQGMLTRCIEYKLENHHIPGSLIKRGISLNNTIQQSKSPFIDHNSKTILLYFLDVFLKDRRGIIRDLEPIVLSEIFNFLESTASTIQLAECDYAGQTLLNLAIQENQFDIAIKILEIAEKHNQINAVLSAKMFYELAEWQHPHTTLLKHRNYYIFQYFINLWWARKFLNDYMVQHPQLNECLKDNTNHNEEKQPRQKTDIESNIEILKNLIDKLSSGGAATEEIVTKLNAAHYSCQKLIYWYQIVCKISDNFPGSISDKIEFQRLCAMCRIWLEDYHPINSLFAYPFYEFFRVKRMYLTLRAEYPGLNKTINRCIELLDEIQATPNEQEIEAKQKALDDVHKTLHLFFEDNEKKDSTELQVVELLLQVSSQVVSLHQHSVNEENRLQRERLDNILLQHQTLMPIQESLEKFNETVRCLKTATIPIANDFDAFRKALSGDNETAEETKQIVMHFFQEIMNQFITGKITQLKEIPN